MCYHLPDEMHLGIYVLYILQDSDSHWDKMYLSLATLLVCLLVLKFAGILWSGNFSCNALLYIPGTGLRNWEQLCPRSTPFEYKMPKASLVCSLELLRIGCRLLLVTDVHSQL
jgi:hypothetical protein